MANGQTNISGGKTLVGTVQPSDVRMGMTYPDGKGLRNGTLDLRNLKPENIKSGVTIGGVVGGLKSLFNMEGIADHTYIRKKFVRPGDVYILLILSEAGSLYTGEGKIAFGGGGSRLIRKITVNKDDILVINNPVGCPSSHYDYEREMYDTLNCVVTLNNDVIIEIEGAKRGRYTEESGPIHGASSRIIKDYGAKIQTGVLWELIVRNASVGVIEHFWNSYDGNFTRVVPSPSRGTIVVLY